MKLSNLSLVDKSIPIGNPKINEIITDAMMMDNVSIIRLHRPTAPIKAKRAPYNIPFLIFPDILQDTTTTRRTNTDHGTNYNN